MRNSLLNIKLPDDMEVVAFAKDLVLIIFAKTETELEKLENEAIKKIEECS